MRCGLAWSLIYRPHVLFLDEPTLGLDVSAIGMMRRFIADYNRETRATILLTSHYMADVEQLCKRVLLINRGALVFDGALNAAHSRATSTKILKVSLTETNLAPRWQDFGEMVSEEVAIGREPQRAPRTLTCRHRAFIGAVARGRYHYRRAATRRGDRPRVSGGSLTCMRFDS